MTVTFIKLCESSILHWLGFIFSVIVSSASYLSLIIIIIIIFL